MLEQMNMYTKFREKNDPNIKEDFKKKKLRSFPLVFLMLLLIKNLLLIQVKIHSGFQN